VDLPVGPYAEVVDSLPRRLAGVLQSDVRVFGIREVGPDFDARFSALWRRYEYRLTDAVSGAEPLRRHDTVAWPRSLDHDAMARAAQLLLGEHDFAAFCRRRAGATTIRTLQELDVERTGDLIRFRVRADAFCHSMVRSLVGSLIAVGDGRRAADWPATLLPSSERASAVVVAPARGLCLMEIRYPEDAGLGARAIVTRNRRG
jgi:tRNA pseudouridine38-40 synthase